MTDQPAVDPTDAPDPADDVVFDDTPLDDAPPLDVAPHTPAALAPVLTAQDADAVRAVVAAATEADGVGPLSEAARLGLERPGRHAVSRVDGVVVGYGVRLDDAVEVVVAPAHRRRGHGRALLDLLDDADAHVWAHGDLPPARALLTSAGFTPVRDLRMMHRPLALRDGDRTAPPAPAGYTVRTFEPGRDDDELLRVNARAFAHHPEQGSLDHAGLADRMATSWFDPAGLFLVDAPDGSLAAFHWTKVDPTDGDPAAGEVYVVGVDPDHQGHGLGSLVTLLGLDHLRSLGLTTVELYVDADNEAAVRTYERLGFTVATIDVQYAHR